MAQCEVCGNDYELAFTVTTAGVEHTFDCFECAVHKLAPVCDHCGCKILGHGIAANDTFYCCAHCAKAEGAQDVSDRDARTMAVSGTSAPTSGAPMESWRGSGLAEEL